MVFTADATSYSDPSKPASSSIDILDGRRLNKVVAVGKITGAPYPVIALYIYPPKPLKARSQYPAIPLTLPVNAEIMSGSFRLPATKNKGDMFVYGRHLPDGVTIVGTTGEVLKLALSGGSQNTILPANTASLISANNAYPAGGSSRISRKNSTADVSGGLLTTNTVVGQGVTLVVSNAGNTAAGNGIGLSDPAQSALVLVDILYCLPDNAVHWREQHSLGNPDYFV